MTDDRAFRTTARLGWATTVLLFGLMVLGSVVRTTGSGLACPDWPLCEGRLIPRFEFHVLIEWWHRLVALLASVLVIGTAGFVLARRALRARLGGLAARSVLLLLVQILLGALTVWKLLAPSVVGSHLAVALLLTLTTLTLAFAASAEAAGGNGARGRAEARTPGSLAVGVATVAAFVQCLLGAAVSTTGAGTVCRSWPTCDGRWFPPLEGDVGLHMIHRYGAYLLVALVTVAALRARGAADPAFRRGTRLALLLVLAQAGLGIANVLLGVPPWLVALHLAAAVLLVAVLLVTTLRSDRVPVPGFRPVPAGAR